jgi:precorrin-2 dehydrogenase / sirohydrochlorin ferrochelatase
MENEGEMETTSDTSGQGHAPSAKGRLYPAFLSLEDKVCVVVGGGHVAVRKVRALLATGAHITVVSPVLHSELQALLSASLVSHIPSEYAVERLAGASIVFAATNNPEVNQQIAQDAHERGLWVNVADNPDVSDFYVPATIHRKDLTVAISTEGGSPAFARYVRTLLEQALSEALGQTLEMIAQARPLILAELKAKQAHLWESLLGLHLETVIETEGYPVERKTFEAWLAQHIGQ